MHFQIRTDAPGEHEAIYAVHLAAFGEAQGAEIAQLTLALLGDETACPLLSLVGETEGRVCGHVLFTHAPVEGFTGAVDSRILAPLAVHPDFQKQGLGGTLIVEGLARLKAAGTQLVFVLGDPDYYGRFGFRPAGDYGLVAPYEIPPECYPGWMVLELFPGTLSKVQGKVCCARSLDDPRHWSA